MVLDASYRRNRQIVGRNQAELGCLQLAYAYDQATGWVEKHRPALLNA
jgi:amidase